MIRTSRRQYSSPPSNSLQSHRRRWLYPIYSMIPNLPKHLRTTTNPLTKYCLKLPASHRPTSSRHRKISPIRPSPMTTLCHRRPYPCFSPTALKHNSCSRHFSSNPILPINRKQHYNPNNCPMFRSNYNPIYSYMRSHSK